MDTLNNSIPLKPTRVYSPAWPGYVLAGLVVIALIVMVVLYIQKPTSCSQKACVNGTFKNNVCTCSNPSDPTKPCIADPGASCDSTTGKCSCDCPKNTCAGCVAKAWELKDMSTWVDCSETECVGTGFIKHGKTCINASDDVSNPLNVPFSGKDFEYALQGDTSVMPNGSGSHIGLAYALNTWGGGNTYKFTGCETLSDVTDVTGATDPSTSFVILGKAHTAS